VFPRLVPAHRFRPVALVRDERTSDFRAPYIAIEATPAPGATSVHLDLVAADGTLLTTAYDVVRGEISVEVTRAAGRRETHRSRRLGRIEGAPGGLEIALTLTGRWLCAWSRATPDDEWTARARVSLTPRVDPQLPGFLDGLTARVREPGSASTWKAGTFGQLGLRDLHLVTHADGSSYERAGRLFLTATHAGPGFGDAAQTGIWSWRPGTDDLRPESLIWWERDGRVVGDHATHLVRDDDRWLVATSTWGDFDRKRVAITLTETTADLLSGEHVLHACELTAPVAPTGSTGPLGRTVAVWDPHLAMVDGHWHIAFVAARKFFDFRPALARAVNPGKDGLTGPLELIGSLEDRVATEGCVLIRVDGRWVMLASDGPDNPAALRGRYPVLDLDLHEIGQVDASYGSNIPWPMVVHHGPPDDPPDQEKTWSMITFDGTPYGGDLPGYGTHGDVLVLRPQSGREGAHSSSEAASSSALTSD
jgi:hypothetical protein